ncbi:hypothetical protein JCM11251_007761 [Rhodosporidiobolus azoricus]
MACLVSNTRLITGGYRTITLDTLEVKANIPPLNLVLRRHLHHFALQLHSSSPSHPCHTPFQRARTSPAHRRHPSSLNRALHSFPDTLPPSTVVKRLTPHALPPWDTPPAFDTIIFELKDVAKLTHDAHLLSISSAAAVVAYLDGSLMDGFAGAGLVTRAWAGAGEADGREATKMRPMGERQ